MANRTSKDNFRTFATLSIGHPNMVSRYSSTCTEHLEVRMGTRFYTIIQGESEKAKADLFPSRLVMNAFSFDNSGHRLSFPQWQSSQSNIDRTNNVLRLIATEFASQSEVVSAIQPLNECVLFLLFLLDTSRRKANNSIPGPPVFMDKLCSARCTNIICRHITS